MKVWNWEGFWSYFTNLYLLEGALWTIGLTVSTLILGGMIGLLLAVMRLSKHKALSRTAEVYVWIFRGTPLLVQLIIIYTGLPQLGLVRFSVIEAAVIGLALNELKKDGTYDKLLDQYGVLKMDEATFSIKGPGPA